MQSSQDCENVLFDFSKSSDWQPVSKVLLITQFQLGTLVVLRARYSVQPKYPYKGAWLDTQTTPQPKANGHRDLKLLNFQVFDKSFFVMKHSIVNESHLYSPPNRVESLRKALETKIRAKVQKWRPLMKTIWNRSV